LVLLFLVGWSLGNDYTKGEKKQSFLLTGSEKFCACVLKSYMIYDPFKIIRRRYFHEGGRHGLPVMKIIHGSELSQKCDFRVSIIMRVDA
jgi:hypothetical protein